MQEIETETYKNLNRAKTILSMLEDEYSIFDTNNPTEKDREFYSRHCGEIYALIAIVKESIDKVVVPVTSEVTV